MLGDELDRRRVGDGVPDVVGVPFVAGVTVDGWLHSRVDALTGLLFLFLATVSPLLLDIRARRAVRVSPSSR